jgi:hypothetical protein
MFWYRSMPITCRCTARRRSIEARASIWTARRWQDWVGGVSRKLQPLVDGLKKDVPGTEKVYRDDVPRRRRPAAQIAEDYEKDIHTDEATGTKR